MISTMGFIGNGSLLIFFFFFSSRRRHTRCALVTGVQTCALPICALDVQVLILGGDARVAELHAEAPAIVRKLLQNDFISHIYFAKKFALFIGIGRPLRKSWKFRTVCPPVTSLMPSVRAFLASTAHRRPTNSRRSEEHTSEIQS